MAARQGQLLPSTASGFELPPLDILAPPIESKNRNIGAVGEHLRYADWNWLWIRLAIDAGHGAAYQTTPLVLRALGAEVVTLNVDPNGRNINADCGSTHPEAMARAQTHFTQSGMDVKLVQCPVASSARGMTPMVFCPSLVPWASETIVAVPI